MDEPKPQGPGALPIEKLLGPFQRFAGMQSAGGIVLMGATALALILANSPWGDAYRSLLSMKVTLSTGGFALSKELVVWINDALMGVFFFVVGLEIKREFLYGELSSPRQAALPAAAALGGMLVPAALFAAFNAGTPALRGWGVPIATDIAFALGVLALCGKGVPFPLKIFLTALAIMDDLGAVLVIALFYTENLSGIPLIVAGACLAAAAGANRLGVRNPWAFLAIGLGCWLATLKSGVHATVAGVLMAMAIPGRPRIDTSRFIERTRRSLKEIEQGTALGREEVSSRVRDIEETCVQGQEPMERLEKALHPWAAFFVLPVFAFANAGLTLDAELVRSFGEPLPLGVFLGLLLGKPLGILGVSWVAVRSGLASLPEQVGWRHLFAAGILAGIGFTMSIFIAGLAFGGGARIEGVKGAVLAASLLAGAAGWAAMKAAVRSRS